MALEEGKPENEKQAPTAEVTPEKEQEKDQLMEESLDGVSGGLIWQQSPTSGNGQYSKPISWTPKS